MRVDLHVHTRYSGHSLLSVNRVAAISRRRGLQAVAITDHDEIRGALELQRIFPTMIGEEVSSDEGDITGLFLTEKVGKGPALEVMDRIRQQGGIVLIPHPFDSLRREAVDSEEICSKADVIEVFNSRVLRAEDNEKARRVALSLSKPVAVGSDAHTGIEIGRSWMDLDSIDDPRSFLKSLATSKTMQRRSPFFVHAQTKVIKALEGLR